ncbi:arsenical-resistance protein [Kwoniella heveanensis CBS 569]|nr:arsenical-resistance protein [Kwoniella heveanensis CBS 569]
MCTTSTAAETKTRSPIAPGDEKFELEGGTPAVEQATGPVEGHARKFANNADAALNTATLRGVSIPIVVGLIAMMWPILTKVQYEKLPTLFRSTHMWRQILLSILLNWIAGPLIMLAVAWATLPDLPTYRTGVIMVGLARRCIAMVMIWNQLAHGDGDYCAILVIVNSILQIILYPPMSLLFVNIISGERSLRLQYGETAIAVLIYLGIPLGLGVATRWFALVVLGRERTEKRFLPYFGPVALLGLLYTIILIFAQQATRITDNIGRVFRIFAPMITYFLIMWTGTFFLVFWLTRRRGGAKKYGYRMAVVQSFTAGSNNFELAIAVCVAVYGVNSDQALAATIGPLVEVPVLLGLSYVSLYLRDALRWGEVEAVSAVDASA